MVQSFKVTRTALSGAHTSSKAADPDFLLLNKRHTVPRFVPGDTGVACMTGSCEV